MLYNLSFRKFLQYKKYFAQATRGVELLKIQLDFTYFVNYFGAFNFAKNLNEKIKKSKLNKSNLEALGKNTSLNLTKLNNILLIHV